MYSTGVIVNTFTWISNSEMFRVQIKVLREGYFLLLFAPRVPKSVYSTSVIKTYRLNQRLNEFFTLVILPSSCTKPHHCFLSFLRCSGQSKRYKTKRGMLATSCSYKHRTPELVHQILTPHVFIKPPQNTTMEKNE